VLHNKLCLEAKNICIFIIRRILMFFYLFPIKMENIVFISFDGKQYSCNPKYIYQYIRVHYPDGFRILWIFRDKNKYAYLNKENVRIIKYGSIFYYYYMLTARFIVTNDYLSSILPIRQQQLLINTWHGGGAYKKVGVATSDISGYSYKFINRHSNRHSKMIKLFLSSCNNFSKYVVRESFCYSGKILEAGMPRNDLLFYEHSGIVKRVKHYFDLPEDAKIILYAPTFRGDAKAAYLDYDKSNRIDTQRCISAFQGLNHKQYFFLYRAHHTLIPETLDRFQINASAYPDIQELLCATDILITDYSSCMWDFSLTNKPCFIYAPDLEKFEKEYGFYIPSSQWPFPIATNNDELITNILNFDSGKYEKDVKRHHNALGSFETGEATKAVMKIILYFRRTKNPKPITNLCSIKKHGLNIIV